jgi:hypothetical protein
MSELGLEIKGKTRMADENRPLFPTNNIYFNHLKNITPIINRTVFGRRAVLGI